MKGFFTMDNTLYWIWLTIKPVITPQKIMSLLEYFNNVEEIYSAKTYFNVPNIGETEAKALRDKSLSDAKRIMERTLEMGADIITFDDKRYPTRLRYIMPPPYILYVRGYIEGIDDTLSIGVVGTRKITDYGKLVTNKIAYALAKNGVLVVSGLARGADTAAAKAALRAKMPTVSVLGCGLDIVYPPENKRITDMVAQYGMVITEYPLGSPPLKTHFPERNRIIAGLSNGIIVTEAPKRSGALITARFAMEYGRDVFAIPGNITKAEYYGQNALIQQGAKLVMSVRDILEEYPYAVKQIRKNNKIETKRIEDDAASVNDGSKAEVQSGDLLNSDKFKNLSDTDKRIVSALMKQDTHIDELSRSLEITAGSLNVKLTLLEMKGAVKKLPGGMYAVNV